MKDNKKYLIIFGLFLVLVLSSLSLLFLPNKSEEEEFAISIVGKNKYGSTLKVEFKNSDNLSLEDFDCHWWYSESADSPNKVYIDGAESYQYKIEEGLVGKYIGVTLTHKDSIGSVTYVDVTDADTNTTNTVRAENTKINFDKKEFIYNGLNLENNFVSANVDSDINYVFYKDNSCKNMTDETNGALYNGGAPVDAGSYYVKVKIDGSIDYNAAVSDCVKIKIKPLDIPVLWSVSDYVYNGSFQGPVAKVDNPVIFESVSLSGTTVINAGSYVSEAKCVEVVGGRGKCSNYNLTKNSVDFKIGASSSIVELSPVVDFYSGQPIFANNAVSNFEGEITYNYYKDSMCTKLVDIDDGVSVPGSAPIDAGKYYVQASIASNGNNTYALSNCVEHIIQPKPITVFWDKTRFVYDGTNKGPTTNLISGISDEAIITSTNTSILPGSYFTNATCNKVIGGRGKCSNYLLVNEVSSYEIDRANAFISLKSKETIYDGQPSYANKAFTNSDGIINYVYYTDKTCTNLTSVDDGALYDGGVPIDAGNYYVTAYVEASNMYNATSSGCVSHIIKPIEVKVDVSNKVLEYDGNIQKNEYTFDYNKLETENLYLDINGYIIPGKYENSVFCSAVDGGQGKCRNYLIKSNSADLIIKKATSIVEIGNYEKVYDSNFINPNYVTNSDGEVVFNYFSDSKCKKLIDYPIDAGKYYVQAKTMDTAFYNEGVSSCVSYEIKPFAVDVLWSGNEFVYNGLEQGPDAVGYGVNGTLVGFMTSKNIDAGTYVSDAQCNYVDDGRNNCANYNFNNTKYEYSISKSYADISFETTDVYTTYPNNVDINYTKISDGVVECYSSDDAVAKCLVNDTSITVVPLNKGNVSFTVKVPDTNNYNLVEKIINVNVELPKYNISLHYNDGTGYVDVQEKLFDIDYIFPSAIPSRIGYKFMGWSVLEDGSSIDYKVGDIYSKNNNKEFYAVWKNTIYINEDFDDGQIHKYFEDVSGEYVISENMKIYNSTSKLVFTPNKNSILSFDIGKVNFDNTNSNSFIVKINGSDNSSYEVYNDNELGNTEFRLDGYKLNKDVTYTLEFVYASDNLDNYGYVDNILVELDESVVNYKKNNFDFMSVINNITSMFDKLFNLIRNMFN